MFSVLNMSGAISHGVIPLPLRVLRGFSSCEGEGVVIGLRGISSGNSSGLSAAPTAATTIYGAAERTLAALLGEREAAGHRDEAVVLELSGAGDLHWVGEAISWLTRHGRRTVLRTDRVLPREVVEASRDGRALVSLRIASFNPAIQRALLGPTADAAARLLLGAQHLRAQGVPVTVRIAPLMPVVHTDDVLASLCRNVVAADLDRVDFAIGGWSPARHAALEQHLRGGGAAALARAYGVFEVEGCNERVRLNSRAATVLQHQAYRIAQDAGLRVGGCGCEAACDVAPVLAEPYRSLLAADLFGAVG